MRAWCVASVSFKDAKTKDFDSCNLVWRVTQVFSYRLRRFPEIRTLGRHNLRGTRKNNSWELMLTPKYLCSDWPGRFDVFDVSM